MCIKGVLSVCCIINNSWCIKCVMYNEYLLIYSHILSGEKGLEGNKIVFDGH